jgi:hypothetical protein
MAPKRKKTQDDDKRPAKKPRATEGRTGCEGLVTKDRGKTWNACKVKASKVEGDLGICAHQHKAYSERWCAANPSYPAVPVESVKPVTQQENKDKEDVEPSNDNAELGGDKTGAKSQCEGLVLKKKTWNRCKKTSAAAGGDMWVCKPGKKDFAHKAYTERWRRIYPNYPAEPGIQEDNDDTGDPALNSNDAGKPESGGPQAGNIQSGSVKTGAEVPGSSKTGRKRPRGIDSNAGKKNTTRSPPTAPHISEDQLPDNHTKGFNQPGLANTANNKNSTSKGKEPTEDGFLEILEKDPCGYFRRRLDDQKIKRRSHKSGEARSAEHLIHSVLLPINDRHTMAAGFSLNYQGKYIRAGRPMLVPYIHNRHSVLIVFQFDTDGKITMDIIGPMLGQFDKEDREAVYNAGLRTLQGTGWWTQMTSGEDEVSQALIPSHANFHLWTRATEKKDSELYSILSAWALAMGLIPRLDFVPRDLVEFRIDVDSIFEIASGRKSLDWKLLLAFFRCHGFVNDEIVLPANTGRFDQQSKDIELLILEQTERSHEGKKNAQRLAGADIARNIRIALPSKGTPHNDLARWSWDECDYLHNAIAILRQDNKAAEWLSSMRNSSNGKAARFTTELGEWLKEEEVHIAIASVTMAITELQRMEGGLSIIGPAEIVQCKYPEFQDPLAPAIRFGRPMLIPLVFEGTRHFILLVMQRDQQGNPSFHVVDSKISHMTRENRRTVYDTIVAVMRRTQWGRNIYSKPDVPSYVNWIRGAQQNNDWICGLYTIFSAWSLAMGLTLDQSFKIPSDREEEERFVRDAYDIVHYAIGGYAGWRLVYAFLRCHGFVKKDRKPARFTHFNRTVAFASDADLTSHLDDLREKENSYWQDKQPSAFLDIRNSNRLNMPQGNPQFFTMSTGTDGATRESQSAQNTVGKVQQNHNEANSLSKTPSEVLQEFQASIARRGRMGHEQLFRTLLGYLDNIKYPASLLNDQHVGSKTKGHCEFWQARVNLFEAAKELFKDQTYETVTYPNIDKPPTKKTAARAFLSDSNSMAAIAAVLEAIDQHQLGLGYEAPFTSGYALISAENLVLAISGIEMPYLMRPRRCWMFPVVVDGVLAADIENYRKKHEHNTGPEDEDDKKDRGHIFLVVMQQEINHSTKKPEFRTYFLDSSPDYYADVRQRLFQKVKSAAVNVGWSTELNDDRSVRFSDRYWTVTVPHQTNNYACGYHTVLNAWILALGLTPRINAVYDHRIAREILQMATLACAGLMDWKTMWAWLRCRDLITEQEITSVPLQRRFTRTQVQKQITTRIGRTASVVVGTDLQERITRIKQEDFLYLGTGDPDNNPYDTSNNVSFAGLTIQPVRATEPDESLPRGYEDFDMLDEPDDTVKESSRKADHWLDYDSEDDWLML